MDDAKRRLGDQYGEWQTNFYGPMKALQFKGRLLEAQAAWAAEARSFKAQQQAWQQTFNQAAELQSSLGALASKMQAIRNDPANAPLLDKQKRYIDRLNYYDKFDDRYSFDQYGKAIIDTDAKGFRQTIEDGWWITNWWFEPASIGAKKQKLVNRINRIEEIFLNSNPTYAAFKKSWYGNQDDLEHASEMVAFLAKQKEAAQEQVEQLAAQVQQIDNAMVIASILQLW